MDLKVPIVILDELSESIIKSSGSLDLASGEIRNVQYEDYDLKALGLPADRDNYEFTSGILSNDGKDVEFSVEVDIFSGRYSVNAKELLEIKLRAAKLFAGLDGEALLAGSRRAPAPAPAADGADTRGARGRKLH